MIENSQHRTWKTKLRNSSQAFKPDERFELPIEAGEPFKLSTRGASIMCRVLATVNRGARTTSEIAMEVGNNYRNRPPRASVHAALKVAVYYGLLEVRVQPLPQQAFRFVYIQPGRNFEGRYKPNLTLDECNERWVGTDAAKLRRWWSI